MAQIADSLGDTNYAQVLMLCDCPGFMVGIESEQQAALRHMCRMMVLGGSITVPVFLVVTRKAYGLGAQAMGVGSHHAPNVSERSWWKEGTE
jgi:acetyl-CoA carboxylase carboxyltransferase component